MVADAILRRCPPAPTSTFLLFQRWTAAPLPVSRFAPVHAPLPASRFAPGTASLLALTLTARSTALFAAASTSASPLCLPAVAPSPRASTSHLGCRWACKTQRLVSCTREHEVLNTVLHVRCRCQHLPTFTAFAGVPLSTGLLLLCRLEFSFGLGLRLLLLLRRLLFLELALRFRLELSLRSALTCLLLRSLKLVLR